MRVNGNAAPANSGRGQRAIPSSAEVTNAQIGNLLIILNNLMPYLTSSPTLDVDKDAAFAASVTFVKATTVLDEILEDKKRWTSDTVDALADALEKLYNTQAELNKASESAVIQTQRPSFLLKPTLTKQVTGEWVAQYGKGRNVLTGVGETPHLAMLAFDMAYYNLTGEQNQNGQ